MPTAREMLDQEPWLPLSIGAVLGGGRVSTAVEQGIRRLARCVSDAVERLAVGDDPGQASVNLVFHVPGDIIAPDYEGMRIGSWVGKRRCQVVQVAVPRQLAPQNVTEFLASSLEQAVPMAAERIKRFRRSADLSTSLASSVVAVAVPDFRSSATQ